MRQSMIVKSSVISVLLTTAFSPAWSATTGETVIGQFGAMNPCSQPYNASTTISVDVPSRLLVSISGSVRNTDAANAYTVKFSSELLNATESQLLATSLYPGEVDPTATYLQYSDTNVLVNANDGTVYTLAQGSYVLKLKFTMGGSCAGAGPYFRNPVMTYLILSSVQDRIFANGFSMLDGSVTPQAFV